ncbi:cilia- and flagella-associated protein 20-like [Lathamus discolor]|uniref:cilia- and flagella-associated protein 20-like n=1 Tax=Lathamus discolor TaxID=678569 RepID=UPI0032B77FB9
MVCLRYIQEHVPEQFSLRAVQHRQQAARDLGQEGEAVLGTMGADFWGGSGVASSGAAYECPHLGGRRCLRRQCEVIRQQQCGTISSSVLTVALRVGSVVSQCGGICGKSGVLVCCPDCGSGAWCVSAIFKNTFQSSFLSVLYSIGSKPLEIWDKKVRNGHIKRITDNDIQSLVLEIEGTNVSTTYITCPVDPKKTLGIKLPFLVMIIKNLKKYFMFEVQVLDYKNIRWRFRASNYQSTTQVKPFICTMPMRLDDGWNQIQFNLLDFTRRAYGTNYIETLRVQIHANCRIRRVYFSDQLYSEDELPAKFKLYLPVQNKAKVS